MLIGSRLTLQTLCLQEKALRFENQLAERDRQVHELQAQLQQAQAAARAQPASTVMVAAPGLALEVTGGDADAAMQDTAGEGHQQELLFEWIRPWQVSGFSPV